MRKVITIICTVTIIVCAVLIVWNIVKERNHMQWEEEFANEFLLTPDEVVSSEGEEDGQIEEEPYVYENLSGERKNVNFKKLEETNDQSIGWIYIPSTTINHPVVQGSNNEYYLKKNIYGQNSVYGSIFADHANIFSPMDTNIVLHGHNMGLGKTSMFSQLVKYANPTWFKDRNMVQFDTKYGTGVWEVFTAFDIDYTADNDGFNYMRENFMNQKDFDDFIAKAKSLSHVYSDANVKYGDKILTLSTCNKKYYGDNGRFVVMAVLREGTLITKKTVSSPTDEIVDGPLDEAIHESPEETVDEPLSEETPDGAEVTNEATDEVVDEGEI